MKKQVKAPNQLKEFVNSIRHVMVQSYLFAKPEMEFKQMVAHVAVDFDEIMAQVQGERDPKTQASDDDLKLIMQYALRKCLEVMEL